jgi:fibronectin type 3 domain-containing protein
VPAGSALLSWSAPSGSVAGYRVYYGTASRSYVQAKGSGLYVTNTTYTVPSLSSGKTYYFAVTAVDASGKESAYSSEATKAIP